MGFRLFGCSLLALVLLLGQVVERDRSFGCSRCAEECPMHAGKTARSLPCHGGAASSKHGGCSLRASCGHHSSSVPLGASVALLVPEATSPAMVGAGSVLSPMASISPSRTQEPPTDPPRAVVAA